MRSVRRDGAKRRHRGRLAHTLAVFCAGLTGIVAFNVIIGVFGLVPAEIGLVAFILTAMLVIARSSHV